MPARRAQEILMLGKELQVLQRSVKRPRLNLWDRLFFVSLFRLGHGVVDNIVVTRQLKMVHLDGTGGTRNSDEHLDGFPEIFFRLSYNPGILKSPCEEDWIMTTR